MAAFLKQLVSKEKRRYVGHGYDLDLTYVTPRVIAMGYPSEKMEGVYRNHRDDVYRFFEQFHSGHYKVYNLCSERAYPPSLFHNRCERYPFDDHNAPPLDMMRPFCEDVHQWLGQHQDNVVAIHCKAGKGRTGVLICAYLVFAGICATADEAMDFYAVARTKNGKGLTIPSQRRYVRYFEALCRDGDPPLQPLRLRAIVMPVMPTCVGGAFHPFVTIYRKGEVIYTTDLDASSGESNPHTFTAGPVVLPMDVPVVDDIKVVVANRKGKKPTPLFHFWLNMSFVHDGHETLTKSARQIDGNKILKDRKDKAFPANFSVELQFVPDTAYHARHSVRVINPLRGAGSAAGAGTAAGASAAAASSASASASASSSAPGEAAAGTSA